MFEELSQRCLTTSRTECELQPYRAFSTFFNSSTDTMSEWELMRAFSRTLFKILQKLALITHSPFGKVLRIAQLSFDPFIWELCSLEQDNEQEPRVLRWMASPKFPGVLLQVTRDCSKISEKAMFWF
ncbi:hypothetical protein D5086_025876 [Populus alba]|uniref:Uncharacterized protein n=1 Tax=Populus alba TaxID=43335 RepID=A0ACC4B199_POPAL